MEGIVDAVRDQCVLDLVCGFFDPSVYGVIVLRAGPFDDLCVADIDLGIRQTEGVAAFRGGGAEPELRDGFPIDLDNHDVFFWHDIVEEGNASGEDGVGGFDAFKERFVVSTGNGTGGKDIANGYILVLHMEKESRVERVKRRAGLLDVRYNDGGSFIRKIFEGFGP